MIYNLILKKYLLRALNIYCGNFCRRNRSFFHYPQF